VTNRHRRSLIAVWSDDLFALRSAAFEGGTGEALAASPNEQARGKYAYLPPDSFLKRIG
jgi:hypothetical protein